MLEYTLNNYITNITTYFKDGLSSEMSYRTDFQLLLSKTFPKEDNYHIQHDPKAVSGNKPDFIIIKNGVPLLYIEVKKVGEDLDKVEKSNQASRYFGYTNLIISDYVNFRFYRNGEKYSVPISLGKIDLKKNEIIIEKDQSKLLDITLLDFIASQREPIKSGKHLAKIMGGKAQRIRNNIVDYLNRERIENKELLNIMDVIKENLISDINIETFADIYAQTLVYGLFVARYNDKTPDTFSRQEARELVPKSNPFLQHFFDHIAGSDFPQRLNILVSELCEVFLHADVHKLMEDYYNKQNPFKEVDENADPVIHFYEDFLLEYDPTKKIEMGVFYTPRPVVGFILRSLDSILKSEFNIIKGLADSQKIKDSESHQVQILDIATGTGTFLNEAIKFIHKSFQGQEGKWESYVKKDLVPRLYGFELMMASYTIAHMKLAMTLEHTGVSELDERLQVYLTNTLDEIKDYSLQGSLFGFMSSIADESQSASRIKNEDPIMVVIGNPPYSGLSQNRHYTENSAYKVEPGGKIRLQEKKHWLDDDYVKFIRFAENMIEKNGEGIVGMITAHGYLDNPTFRGMRWHLRKTFDKIYVLDLHGNANKKEQAPNGSIDENVFDIKTGVAIIIGVKKKRKQGNKSLATVYSGDLYGTRHFKQDELNTNDITTIKWNRLPKEIDIWKVEGNNKVDYMEGFSVKDTFKEISSGFVTARDKINICFTKDKLLDNMYSLIEKSDQEVRLKFNLNNKDSRDWKVSTAKQDAKQNFTESGVRSCSYRPFDIRFTFFSGNSRGVYASPQTNIMKHFILGQNIGLVISRQVKAGKSYQHCLVTKNITESSYVSNKTGEIGYTAPLYLYLENGERLSNINDDTLLKIKETLPECTPEDLFDYIYAYLHNPKYRQEFEEFLKRDFPRIPYPENLNKFHKYVEFGKKLRNLHTLDDPIVKKPNTTYPISGENFVEKITYIDNKVKINEKQYFGDVPESVWDFYIGGYQPARKFLKDRKNNKLTIDDIDRYQEMIVALTETIIIMKQLENIY